MLQSSLIRLFLTRSKKLKNRYAWIEPITPGSVVSIPSFGKPNWAPFSLVTLVTVPTYHLYHDGA